MAGRAEGGVGPFAALAQPRTRVLVGVLALVVTAAIAAWSLGWLTPAPESESARVTVVERAPRKPRTTVPATVPAPVEESVVAGSPAVGVPPVVDSESVVKGTVRPGTRLASTQASDAAVVTAVTPDAPAPVRTVAQLDEHVTYQYNALGRRDPFVSLVGGDFVGMDVGGDAPPDPGGIKVVGIVWGASDQFAMVEDVRGNSHVLRKGDRLQNAVVDDLRRDALVVTVTADGQSQQVVIPFTRKGDGNDR